MIGSHFYSALIASCLAAFVTTMGLFTIQHFSEWGKKHIAYFSCFAAGVLISASFLYIVPKAFLMNNLAPIFLLIGYLFIHFINKFITAYVCTQSIQSDIQIGVIPMIGVGFHSFLDGMIYSVTFTVGTFMGILATSGMIMHEFPEGIVIYLLLMKSGFSQKRSFFFAFLTTAITTPVGMLVFYPFISQISQSLLGILLAFSAGTLIYVGATHLLPFAEKEPKRYSVVAFIVGVLFAVGMILLK